jgi:hypothetical protein
MKWANCCDAISKHGSTGEMLPLASWADRQLDAFAAATGSTKISHLSGAALLSQRASHNEFTINGRVSAGGSCQLYPTRDGLVALSLARADDRAMLPALFCDADFIDPDNSAIAARLLTCKAHDIVTHGSELGLAIASANEIPASPAFDIISTGPAKPRHTGQYPHIVDLSALWAGPLASHILQLAGGHVTKVESQRRPDAMRTGDPAFYNVLNGNKTRITLDIHSREGSDALISLIRHADIVVTAARPRALLQLGLDADAFVAQTPGLVWINITGHGVRGAAAQRIGFGDDCAVAGGLTAALQKASGAMAFVGDAPADPLTGLMAAQLAHVHWCSGKAAHIALSMSGVIAAALKDEIAHDSAQLTRTLRNWAAAIGQRFPGVAQC